MIRSLASLCVLVLLALSLAACGGSGTDAAPPTQDLTGYWLVYLTPAGSSTETGPAAAYLSQDGAVITGPGTIGTMSGPVFSMTVNSGGFVAAFNGTASANSATGTITLTGVITATGTFRLARFSPIGTMNVSGTVGGNSVNVTTSAAYGSLDYGDAALTMLDEVEIGAADENAQLEIDFSPGGLAVGALSVPSTITAVVLYRTGATAIESDTSGTVTITQYDGNGIAGSFTLTLTSGGTLTGTFDVAFDMDSYDP